MMSGSATMATPRKRTRFNDDDEVIAPAEQVPKTPTAVSKDYVSLAFASLPSAPLQSLAIYHCNAFLKLRHLATHQDATRTKLQEADYNPRSARVGFTLRASKRLEDNIEFEALVTSTEELVTKFQSDLKKNIL